MTTTSTALAPLGRAALDEAAFVELVRVITGHPGAEPLATRVDPVPYPIGTPTTAELLRVRGTALLPGGERRHWSCFVKRLQSAKWWDGLHLVPAPLRDDFIANIPWRVEIAVQRSNLASLLPQGLRLATSYRIDEYDDERATLWMENVEPTPGPWGLERFERSAYLLGRLSARRQAHLVEPLLPRQGITTPGMSLRYYVDGRVLRGTIPVLADDATWQHPVLKEAVEACGESTLRGEFLGLAERLPAAMDGLDRLPQCYQHGDASPQNLLVPADSPEEFVAIDWGFDSPQAVGFDLGQLLVGLAHAGELAPEALPAVHRVIVPAFCEGLEDEGLAVSRSDVEYGYLGSLLARATFTALPLECLAAPESPALVDYFTYRVRLARALVDLTSQVDLTSRVR
ncbi:phosphotransferase [Kribbella deserti]|uniref:Phosphotransferase n=1 Tax=Kribbella deserti TaxID=1926257 RepID=A0ABV6QMS8_9ACTN